MNNPNDVIPQEGRVAPLVAGWAWRFVIRARRVTSIVARDPNGALHHFGTLADLFTAMTGEAL
jgi:hypothetical protein